MIGDETMEEIKPNDIISHPSHYCEGREYEPKDVIADWDKKPHPVDCDWPSDDDPVTEPEDDDDIIPFC